MHAQVQVHPIHGQCSPGYLEAAVEYCQTEKATMVSMEVVSSFGTTELKTHFPHDMHNVYKCVYYT